VPAQFRQILSQDGLQGVYCIPSFSAPALEAFGAAMLALIILGIFPRASAFVVSRLPLMLEHLGHPEAAKAVVDAIEAALVEGPRTPDIGGNAKTADLGRTIADAL